MFPQRSYTIIIVTFDCIARVDLVSRKSLDVVNVWRTDRSDHVESADAAAVGVKLGPKKCGRLFVLSSEVWTGCVSLANEVIEAVTDDQLNQTLALEAEHTSGISPFDSRLGWVSVSSVDGSRSWWVTQAEWSELDALATSLPKWAGTVAGMASTVISAPLGNVELRPSDTNSTAACGALAHAWLSKYLSDVCVLPVIRMSSQSWLQQHQQAVRAVAAISALAVCGVFHLQSAQHLQRVKTELALLSDQEKQLRATIDAGESAARQFRSVKLERDNDLKARALQRAAEDSRRVQHNVLRKRPVEVLHALLATADQRHWIHGIDLNGSRVSVSGLAIDTTSVIDLATGIEAELDALHWLVQPAAMAFEEVSGLVRFDLSLAPRGPAPSAADVARSGVVDVR